MRGFRQDREDREDRVAGERQQDMLAEQHQDAGEPEHDEARRVQPVRGTLDEGEALDQLAGGRLAQADLSTINVEQRDQDQHRHQEPAAPDGHRSVAQLPPVLTARLDQHTALELRQLRRKRLRRIDLAPDRCVVQRLDLLAPGRILARVGQRFRRRFGRGRVLQGLVLLLREGSNAPQPDQQRQEPHHSFHVQPPMRMYSFCP